MSTDDSLTEVATFCIEAETMVEFYLAATTSPGTANWNVESFYLADGNDVILARSFYNLKDAQGRTFTLQYKSVITEDTDYKIMVETHSGDVEDDDADAPMVDAKNLQWGVRQYNGKYGLDGSFAADSLLCE